MKGRLHAKYYRGAVGMSGMRRLLLEVGPQSGMAAYPEHKHGRHKLKEQDGIRTDVDQLQHT